MMQFVKIFVASGVAVVLVGGGLLCTPLVFANRILPGVTLGEEPMGGVPRSAVSGVVAQYERELQGQSVAIVLRGREVRRPLGSLGLSLDHDATVAAIGASSQQWAPLRTEIISPTIRLNQSDVASAVAQEFQTLITVPRNATLTVSPSRTLVVAPSATGETVDLTTLGQDITARTRYNDWGRPIELVVVSAPASVHEGELGKARDLAQKLLSEGLPLSDGAATWTIKPFTLARLLRFIPVSDPDKPGNEILGVTVDAAETSEYLTTTLTPEINQPAIDARFERSDDHVTQFAVPQAGKALNIEQSVIAVQTALVAYQPAAPIIVDTTQPTVSDEADIDALGLTHLLATGTSDFAGSPANRVHNVLEGTKHYHGLLIQPGQEFSFNQFLGPVDGEHGFKPELVIKKNVTIPEFGGGLCQVSTTLFRAAVEAGLQITQRRNHAYAVRYYGTPGFDATIYPPYTDLRFTNNTPGYLLIQTRVEGTHLAFELWGTDDGREVVVDGPHTYGRTPDGAVKATLTQKVTKQGDVIVDQTFYSRYQSPKLFPKTVTNAAPATNPTPPPAGEPTSPTT